MKEIDRLLKEAFDAFRAKRLEESAQLYREVLAITPDNGVALHTLGVINDMLGRNQEAVEHMRLALDKMTGDPAFFYNFGLMLQKQRRYDEAIKNYREAIRLRPGYTSALNNIAAVLLLQGNLSEAEQFLRRALATDPDYYLSYDNLGSVLKDQGRFDEAVAMYRKALEIKPTDEQAGSNLLMCLCYNDALDRQFVFEEHKAFAVRHLGATPVKQMKPADYDAERALRIGYLSADFRTHSVAYFMEPVLARHNRDRFKIFCYADGPFLDPMTRRLMGYGHEWRQISGKSDDEVAALIEADQVDIMVDLAGHSGYNRLPLFLRRVAPLQVTYLGYPNTTGLPTMDWRITDTISDQPEDQRWYTEKLLRLEQGFLCYFPPRDAPEVQPPPVLRNRYITFGSFNNLPKITSTTMALWAEIMHTNPGSHLLIKTKPFNDPEIKREYIDRFGALGIPSERLDLRGHEAAIADHLSIYHEVDIALDTFPYNGTTTTFEALWMGVPVISCHGTTHASRVGLSILTTIGLAGMATSDPKKFAATASFLSRDVARLDKFRLSLRSALAQSPLCDAAGFCSKLETGYRLMWREFLSRVDGLE